MQGKVITWILFYDAVEDSYCHGLYYMIYVISHFLANEQPLDVPGCLISQADVLTERPELHHQLHRGSGVTRLLMGTNYSFCVYEGATVKHRKQMKPWSWAQDLSLRWKVTWQDNDRDITVCKVFAQPEVDRKYLNKDGLIKIQCFAKRRNTEFNTIFYF